MCSCLTFRSVPLPRSLPSNDETTSAPLLPGSCKAQTRGLDARPLYGRCFFLQQYFVCWRRLVCQTPTKRHQEAGPSHQIYHVPFQGSCLRKQQLPCELGEERRGNEDGPFVCLHFRVFRVRTCLEIKDRALLTHVSASVLAFLGPRMNRLRNEPQSWRLLSAAASLEDISVSLGKPERAAEAPGGAMFEVSKGLLPALPVSSVSHSMRSTGAELWASRTCTIIFLPRVRELEAAAVAKPITAAAASPRVEENESSAAPPQLAPKSSFRKRHQRQ